MPRKKQTVQTKKRQKTYREGELSGAAVNIKPRGFFKFFGNYRLFAIIGAVGLIGGLAISALFATQGGGDTSRTDVRGPGVIRETPEAGETSTTGAAPEVKQYSAPPALAIDPTKQYTAVIKTDKGEIKVALRAEDAPTTVNNFVFLARDGYYDGVTFHRVIKDFVAQSGDPTGTGVGGPGYDLAVEETEAEVTAGVLAMAKPNEAGAMNNGSQFYFVLSDQPTLEGKATVFGEVVEGLEVLQSLNERNPDAAAGLDPGDRIESITIQEA